ncbi:hypothetical protein FCIRC_225 [Fusarium circinatum]|uniref:Uncharacterized protein n=1 Tax=Fusarium circinatum TaxID=48490 RepID=A0A8H6CU11_FUSCI|nr:hypothetical protein FCIRC_225 [Fusarium circinatum]
MSADDDDWEEKYGNTAWQKKYNARNLNNRKLNREQKFFGEPVAQVGAEDRAPNGCYKLDNTPIGAQVSAYNGPSHGSDEILRYDCFMPTGEIYEFLPCAPYRGAQNDILGFKEVRGIDTIMDRYGNYNGEDTKSGDTLVGDCFIRLEEVHNRMRGDLQPYIDDCKTALKCAGHEDKVQNSKGAQKAKALRDYSKYRRELGGVLRFRCWAVEGVASLPHEKNLCIKLFFKVTGRDPKRDRIEEFRVWAEILRKSQGDKLASKDFFGRYWDAAIPLNQGAIFQDGFAIVIGEEYFQHRGLNHRDTGECHLAKTEVFNAAQRVIDAPRIKFRPPLSPRNVVLWDEAPTTWRVLEAHPAGLYSIRVDPLVENFLCHRDHPKPLWQTGYTAPGLIRSEMLQEDLDKCKKTSATTTQVQHDYVVGARKGKRKPTQDRVVAKDGFSANAALAKALPQYYPDAAKAKKGRVAEWLHRYEAFVKRLAFYSKNMKGQRCNTVVVKTRISYPVVTEPALQWMVGKKYTWLAPNLVYEYQNHKDSYPHVNMTRTLYPFNRESSMLFQSLLDKSLEEICWRWPCWNDAAAVEEALLESTGVDGNEEENNQEEIDKKLRKDLAERDNV